MAKAIKATKAKGVIKAYKAPTGSFVDFANQVANDPARSRKVTQDAGIITKTGRLSSPYR